MADKLIANFERVLDDKIPALVQAKDAAEVRGVLEDVKTEAARNAPIFYTDAFIYRMTVTVLGATVLAVIVAQLWITLVKSPADIPDGMIAIGSAAIGALAGLLAPTPAR